ncbi:MAG: hypothetical protein FWF37_00660 [Chloroflexi bacterium]|nr:hypothetical protein [Chloroflexota bacterium]
MSWNAEFLQEFLSENFPGLNLHKPLLYEWQPSMRVRISVDCNSGSDKEYKEKAAAQSLAWFSDIFGSEKELLIVNDYKKKISLLPVLQQYTSGVQSQILQQKVDYNGNISVVARDIFYGNLKDARIKDILYAIVNKSYGGNAIGQVYFIQLTQKIIFDLYGEEGADIAAAGKEELLPIYLKLSDLVSPIDRGRTEKALGIL